MKSRIFDYFKAEKICLSPERALFDGEGAEFRPEWCFGIRRVSPLVQVLESNYELSLLRFFFENGRDV
jgi:hypothetical protein